MQLLFIASNVKQNKKDVCAINLYISKVRGRKGHYSNFFSCTSKVKTRIKQIYIEKFCCYANVASCLFHEDLHNIVNLAPQLTAHKYGQVAKIQRSNFVACFNIYTHLYTPTKFITEREGCMSILQLAEIHHTILYNIGFEWDISGNCIWNILK